MYILTMHGNEKDGAYCVHDELGNNILYMFEESDDALRFARMLEDDGYPEMNVLEVEDDVMVRTCEVHDYQYVIISPNDIVIPPKDHHDFI